VSVTSAPRLPVPRRPGGGFRLRRRIARFRAPGPRSSLTAYEFSVFSQNGEDGVLYQLFRRLGVRSRYFVEFGAGTGAEANCVLLADVYGWRGLFMESESDPYRALERKYRGNPKIRTKQTSVTAQNVDALLLGADVPPEIDLLSIDIDGNDFWVWRAIGSVSARVVVIEYNANLVLKRELVMPRDDAHRWDETDYYGASLGAYRALAQEKGYRLIHTDRTGVNAFFVRDAEWAALSGLVPDPPRPANYLGLGYRHARDPHARPFLDLATGGLVEAGREPHDPAADTQ
jgi:hypothetical protein